MMHHGCEIYYCELHNDCSRLSTRLCGKKGFLKRFNFQKERFLQLKKVFGGQTDKFSMPEKRYFYCMHT